MKKLLDCHPERRATRGVEGPAFRRQCQAPEKSKPFDSARTRPAKMCRRQPLVEGTRRVLAIALDFDFLFALRHFTVLAAILIVLRNYALALLVPALLTFIRHRDVPFQQLG